MGRKAPVYVSLELLSRLLGALPLKFPQGSTQNPPPPHPHRPPHQGSKHHPANRLPATPTATGFHFRRTASCPDKASTSPSQVPSRMVSLTLNNVMTAVSGETSDVWQVSRLLGRRGGPLFYTGTGPTGRVQAKPTGRHTQAAPPPG